VPAPTMIELRDYQEACVVSIFDYFAEKSGNPLIALPTGTGKSVVMAGFIERALKLYPKTKILILTHVKELIAQNHKAMKALWKSAPAGIYSAGLNKREHHYPITFAGIASIHKRSQQFGHQDIIIIDEAHLVGDKESAMYIHFIQKMKKINPYLKVIGATATKWRMGMGQLTNGQIFDEVCFDLTDMRGFNWLLAEGYLKPLIPKPMDTEFDVSGVGTSAGEYKQNELQDAVDKDDLNEAAVNEIIKHGIDRKHWLIFSSGVDHALHLQSLLCNAGVDCTTVHSRMTDDERDANILGYRSGKYQAIVNYGVLTTGFDFPEIDMIAVLRPTKSSGLWVQMLGRGTRPVYRKDADLTSRDGRLEAMQDVPNCLVLDFARNTERLGPINDPVMPRKKGEGKPGMAPIKLCPHCNSYNHASATICAFCGGEMPRTLKFEPKASNEVLIRTAVVEPVITTYDVSRVVYQRHTKQDKPDSLRVSYYTKGGLRRFDEWILLEHSGPAQHRARLWWMRRNGNHKAPETITEALILADSLLVPAQIKVRTDTKFPEITDHNLIGLTNDSLQSSRPAITTKPDATAGNAQEDGGQWLTH
jgi:DNA repair protein RadD